MAETRISRGLILAVWVVGLLLITVISGSFSFALFSSIASNMVPIFFMAIAVGLIISMGEIDISVGGVLSFSGMLILLCTSFFELSVIGVFTAHIAAIAFIFSFYFIFSSAMNKKIPSLIFSIGALLMARGGSTFIQSCMQGVGEVCRGRGDGAVLGVLSSDYVLHWLGDPFVSLILMLSTVSVLYWIKNRTSVGLEHIAVGMNRESALYSKISISKVRLRAVMGAAVLLSLTLIFRLHGQNNGGWSANTGWGEEIIAIAIAVIGGTRISGGRFEPFTIFVASLAVFMTRDVVTNDLGVPSEVASIIFGAALLLIVAADLVATKRSNIVT